VSFRDKNIPFMCRRQFNNQVDDERLTLWQYGVKVCFGRKEESIKEKVSI
jgi:hypothetical protein